MTIPNIQPYPMPRGEDLPQNRVSWKLEPSRAVLLIHDMQQYFVGHYDAKASPIVELLGNIDMIRQRCAASGVPVVYTKQTAQQTPAQRGLLTDVWGPGLTDHPSKEPIVKELTPSSADTVLIKWRYNAFHRTDLLSLMQQWGRDQIIICGVYAHIGCLLTASDAFMHDVKPFLVGDAIADFSLDNHKMALNYVAQRCGVALSTRDVVTALDAGSKQVSAAPRQGPEEQELTMARLRSEVSDLLQQPDSEIGDHDSLLELGFDSIRLMTLVERVRSTGVEVTFIELAEQPTLDAWWGLVSSRLPSNPKLSQANGASIAIQA